MHSSNIETKKKYEIEGLPKFFKDRSKKISKAFSNEVLEISTIRSRNPSYGLVDKERHRNRRLFGLHGVGNQNRKNMN